MANIEPRSAPQRSRHKFKALPVWACKECCATTSKPSEQERTCRSCGSVNAVCYFDSRRELTRWAELKMLERHGYISNLQIKPKFSLPFKTFRSYEADAQYFENGKCVVEDSKGVRTREYRLKKELVEHLYPGLKIIEV